MIAQDVRSEMIRFCHRMDQKGWVANHDGNISVRSGSHFAATPTARAKFDLQEVDLIEVDAEGKKQSGLGGPFSEMAIHLRIFQARPDVHAVVHSHAPFATAVGLANQEMLSSSIPEAVVSIGPGVPLVGLELPGSQEFWSQLDPLLAHYDAVMVAGNGIFSWGKTLEQAFLRMELVEHLARVLLESSKLGGPLLLQSDQIAVLLKKRVTAGLGLPDDPARPHWFPKSQALR